MGRKIEGRELLEACYLRKFKFDNMEAFDRFTERLKSSHIEFKVLNMVYRKQASIFVTIATSYNNAPFMFK